MRLELIPRKVADDGADQTAGAYLIAASLVWAARACDEFISTHPRRAKFEELASSIGCGPILKLKP
jgi:hypothetical protein